jgi:AcrR family transcriptional regulator
VSSPAGERSERGYRNFLTLPAILSCARELADTQGLAAVSMRTIADRLYCTPRALYRHVAGKDEVLELIADAALGELPVVRRNVPWPEALVEFFLGMHRLLVESPAVAEIVTQLAVAGPHFRAHADVLVGLLLEAELEPELAAEAVVALAQFTLGAAVPGTGQRLHDAYRALELDGDAGAALGHVRRYFVASSASERFESALRRLVGAYADARG